MSNRNFDSHVIIQRLQNQNYARNLYSNATSGRATINNPQTSNGDSSRYNSYVSGAQTEYFRGLIGGGETISVGGIVNISPFLPEIATVPAPAPTPGPTVPDAPTIISITPGNTQLTVNFTAGSDGGSAITDYEYSTDNGSSFTSAGITTSPIVITGLANGTPYQVAIRAVNSVGSSASSNIVSSTPATTPSAPTITSITPGNTQLSVAFTAGSDGGSNITNYLYSINGGSVFTVFSPSQSSSPVTITGLVNGTTYQVALKAVNSQGTSAVSNIVSGTPSIIPDPPTNLSGTPGNQQITVTFTSGSNQGSAITNYQYSTDNGTTFRAFSPADATSPVTITSLSSNGITLLTNGTPYTIALKAVNANGASISSSTITVIPGNITSLYLPNVGTTSIWTDSEGSLDATMSGPPIYTGTQGYIFNGTTQYGRIASSSGINDFTNTNNYTVEVWFNPSSGQPSLTLATVLEKWNSTNQSRYPYVFRYAETFTTLSIAAYDGINNPTTTITGINTGSWYQVSAVFDFINNKLLTVYKNGIGANTISLSSVGNVSNTSQLAIAHRIRNTDGAPQFLFKGSIGLIRIYNFALSSTQILDNFNLNKSTFGL
jgi:hypothetical protein